MPASMQGDNKAVFPFDRVIFWILSLRNHCRKYAFARWLMSPIASIASSSQILCAVSLNSDCIVSILLLHDDMMSLAPCLLLNIGQA